MRDNGVEDHVWEELRLSKLKQYTLDQEAILKCQEEAARRIQAEMEIARLAEDAKEKARLEEDRKIREFEEQKRIAEQDKKKREKILEKLRQITPCPAGYRWFQCGGGWRCGGGSHYVTNDQLERSFTF